MQTYKQENTDSISEIKMDAQHCDSQTDAKKLICWDFDHTITQIHVHNTLMNFYHALIRSEQGVALKAKLESEGKKFETIMGLDYFSSDIMTHYMTTLLNPGNIRDLNHIAQKMIEAYEKGHHQAVTSFTWFPQVAKPTIRFILENYLLSQNASATEKEARLLEEQQAMIEKLLGSIHVVGGFPKGELHESPVVGGGSTNHPLAKGQHMQCAMTHFGIEDRSHVCLIDDSSRNIDEAIKQGFTTVHAHIDKEPAQYLQELSQFMFTVQEQHEYDFLRTPMIGGIPRELLCTSSSDDIQETVDYLNEGASIAAGDTFSLSNSVELVGEESMTCADDSKQPARFEDLPLNPFGLRMIDDPHGLLLDTLLVPCEDEQQVDHVPLRNVHILPTFELLRDSSQEIPSDHQELSVCDDLAKSCILIRSK